MSTGISELTNEPISFKIGGKEVKIKRLNLAEIFGYFETKVKEQHMNNIRDVASLFEDKKDKADYLKQATRDIPNKTQLQRLANDYIQTEEGMVDVITIGLNKCQKLTDEELVEMFKNSNEEEIQLVVSYLFGIELPKEDSEKKTITV